VQEKEIMRNVGLAVCLVLSGLLLGCSRTDQAADVTTTSEGPVPGDWAILQFGAEPDSLNPILSSTAYSTYVEYGVNFSNVFETLLQYDRNHNWSFSKPLLAEAYPEVSPDHLHYTFLVRDGIKWHDGQALTAADILFSFKAAISPGVDDAPLRTTVSDLTNVEVLEGRKLQFSMKKPYFMNDFALGTFPIVAKHIFDPEGLLDK